MFSIKYNYKIGKINFKYILFVALRNYFEVCKEFLLHICYIIKKKKYFRWNKSLNKNAKKHSSKLFILRYIIYLTID